MIFASVIVSLLMTCQIALITGQMSTHMMLASIRLHVLEMDDFVE